MVKRGERPRAAMVAFALLLLALVIAAVVAAPPARSQGGEAGLTGVASCAGSTCHGRMEGDGIVVRQDELMKWQEPSSAGGAHSRAWAVLSNSRSQFIARNLGIGDPSKASMCLGCHSTAGQPRRSRSMTGSGASRATDPPADGFPATMRASAPTRPRSRNARQTSLEPPRRALEARGSRRACRSLRRCHFGSKGEGQFVTHRIMAAGHRAFPSNSTCFRRCRRIIEDADYGWRKFGSGRAHRPCPDVGGGAGGRARTQPRPFPVEARDRGDVPEFFFLDCHSCHRRIFDQAKPLRTGVDNPGRAMAGASGRRYSAL
jgi:hypothetical protein